MSELKSHVDKLFRNHGNSKQVRELRDEILMNLEAKKEDLTQQGYGEKEAIEQAVRSIQNVDGLIEHNRLVDLGKYRLECFQWLLIYLSVAWIVTTPLRLFRVGASVNFLLLFAIVIAGAIYIFLGNQEKRRNGRTLGYLDHSVLRRRKNIVWGLWGLFFLVAVGTISAVQFGSNVWFGRPIRIDGPYAFGMMAIRYLLPFVSIVIPLYFAKTFAIVDRYEVGDQDEE